MIHIASAHKYLPDIMTPISIGDTWTYSYQIWWFLSQISTHVPTKYDDFYLKCPYMYLPNTMIHIASAHNYLPDMMTPISIGDTWTYSYQICWFPSQMSTHVPTRYVESYLKCPHMCQPDMMIPISNVHTCTYHISWFLSQMSTHVPTRYDDSYLKCPHMYLPDMMIPISNVHTCTYQIWWFLSQMSTHVPTTYDDSYLKCPHMYLPHMMIPISNVHTCTCQIWWILSQMPTHVPTKYDDSYLKCPHMYLPDIMIPISNVHHSTHSMTSPVNARWQNGPQSSRTSQLQPKVVYICEHWYSYIYIYKN